MITILTAILALSASYLAFFYYRKTRQYIKLLIEGGKLYDVQSRELEFAHKKITNFAPVQKTLENDLHAARSSLLASTTKASQIEGQSIQMQASYERKITHIESQRDHILGKFDALQIELADRISKQLQDQEQMTHLTEQVASLKQQRDAAKDLASLNLKSENSDLRRKVNDLERDLAFHKARKEIDPKDFETIKRKATHSDQLYRSMKGLRDLTDERNRNWEQALTHLSTWILTQSPLARAHEPALTQPVGALVGEALERIGASLINTSAHEELAAERNAIQMAD